MMYDALGLFYDHFYTDEAMTESELAFLEWAFAELAGREVRDVWDVSCGTGRQALRLAGKGYRVTASDPSPAMLEALRARPGAADLTSLQRGMADLAETEACDAVISVFTAINHVVDDGELRRSFAGFHRALRPGGLAVFDVANFLNLLGRFEGTLTRHHARKRTLADGYQETRARHLDSLADDAPWDEVLSVIRHQLDDVEGVFMHREDIFCRTGDEWTRHVEHIPLRVFTRRELVADLERAGFEDVRVFRGYDDRGESRDNSFRLVFVARR